MIDYKAKLAQEENALEQMLANRKASIPGVLSGIRSDVEAGRGEQDFGGVASKFNLDLGAWPSDEMTSRMGLSLDEAISNQGFKMDRNRVNLSYNRALDRAEAAGASRKEAENFARQFMQDEIRRQAQGTQAQKQRNQRLEQQRIQNNAMGREQEIQLNSIADPMDEYQSAVMRIMTGMPTQLLSYWAFNRAGSQPSTPKVDVNGWTKVPGSHETGF